MELTEKEYSYLQSLSFDELEKLREKVICKKCDSRELELYLGYCIYRGIKRKIKQEPELKLFNQIFSFIDEVKING